MAAVKDVQPTVRTALCTRHSRPFAVIARRRFAPWFDSRIRIRPVIAVGYGSIHRDEVLKGVYERARRALIGNRTVDIGILANRCGLTLLRDRGARQQGR